MQTSALPLSRDLVLVGGGHTHALVLRKWGMNPLPGARLTVINPGPTAPYSGMLPGYLAGHYSREALDIDLVQLARFANARIIAEPATGLDLTTREIFFETHPPVGFDITSFDIGITSKMPNLPGFPEHAVPAKPLGHFADAWQNYRDKSGPASVAVIGGGVAGVEITMALAHALRARGRETRLYLIDEHAILAGVRPHARAILKQALSTYHVNIIENASVNHIDSDGIQLNNGRHITAEFITGAAGARPHSWLERTGLALHEGFINVDPKLRSSDPHVFAVGDCAHMAETPRPKAGVYAVRQAPVLFDNLRAALTETGGFRSYKPQRNYLKLISMGSQNAIADRVGLSPSGPWLWRWKDRIDQRFMEQFRSLPTADRPALPWPRAAGSKAALGPKPLCGGCGSKIGRKALSKALKTTQIGDDAAILQTGSTRQVISTDHLRALTLDPAVMASVATVHALGDIWAMGAKPQAATLNVILPRMTDLLATRSLAEIHAAAQAVLSDAGAQLVGGHSTIGAELTIGLTVTGLCESPPITLAGAQPEDSLILTKPIGSGVIMAAEMQGKAGGKWVLGALEAMMRAEGPSSHMLRHAHAMTDVTGFGLVGHLRNICEASGTGAALSLDCIPFLDGAEALSARGIQSSLYRENRLAAPDWPSCPRTDLLFDPQTGGGLLAAIPNGPAVLHQLADVGIKAYVIGTVTDQAGIISLV